MISGYRNSARISETYGLRFCSPSDRMRDVQNFLIAEFLLESAGRRLAEAIFVRAGKIAEMPESPVHGHIGNGRGTALGLTKFIPGPM